MTDTEATIPTLDNIEKLFPKPWGKMKIEGGEQRFGLNENGKQALCLILMMHKDCVDSKKAFAFMEAEDEKGFFREVAKGAKKFVEQHRESGHSCVPGVPLDGLIMLMGTYGLWCKFKAGDLTQLGEPVN